MNHILRIGSRKSVLALRQAEMIAEQLKNKFPGLQTEILTRDTLGDQLLHSPLQAFGGKGAFVSEFEQALLEGSIDLAVHSGQGYAGFSSRGAGGFQRCLSAKIPGGCTDTCQRLP